MEKLSRQYIQENTIAYYRRADGTRPDLRLVRWNDKKVIVKDFRYSGHFFRYFIGPFLVRREYKALHALADVEGVPNAVCRIDRHSFAMENIDGQPLDKADKSLLTNDFYEQLKRIIHDIHKRGITHNDMRSKGNVMLGADGKPYVIDFAACLFYGRGYNPLIRWVFKQFVVTDDNAVVRVKSRNSPWLITDDEKKELARVLPYEHAAKRFSEPLRRFFKRFSRK